MNKRTVEELEVWSEENRNSKNYFEELHKFMYALDESLSDKDKRIAELESKAYRLMTGEDVYDIIYAYTPDDAEEYAELMGWYDEDE